jgi:hypothetical protein
VNVVYTVILDAWDYLRPPEVVDPKARYICYTNHQMPACPPWEFQPAYCPFDSGARNSRLPKILPDLHFRADYSVYHDANFTLKRSPEYLVERYLAPKKREMAMFVHPARTNVEQEAGEIIAHPEWFPNVDMSSVYNQVERWKEVGRPEGLWAAGMIIRKHTPDVAAFNRLWWREFMAGSPRDQLSLPVARHLAGMKIEDIHGNIIGGDNDLMGFHWHAAWKDKEDNPAREKRLRPYVERMEELKRLCNPGMTLTDCVIRYNTESGAK